MNHPPFPPPGLFSSLLRPRPPWAASGPEQHRPGVGAARWSRSRRPCALVPAPGGRGQRGPGVRSRSPVSRREAAAAPVPGLARSDPGPRPCRPGPDPCTPAAPRAGCRKGAGWLSPAPDPATRLRPRPRRRGARPAPPTAPLAPPGARPVSMMRTRPGSPRLGLISPRPVLMRAGCARGPRPSGPGDRHPPAAEPPKWIWRRHPCPTDAEPSRSLCSPGLTPEASACVDFLLTRPPPGRVCGSPVFRVSLPQLRPQAQGTSFTLSCLGLLIGPRTQTSTGEVHTHLQSTLRPQLSSSSRTSRFFPVATVLFGQLHLLKSLQSARRLSLPTGLQTSQSTVPNVHLPLAENPLWLPGAVRMVSEPVWFEHAPDLLTWPVWLKLPRSPVPLNSGPQGLSSFWLFSQEHGFPFAPRAPPEPWARSSLPCPLCTQLS